MSRLREVIGWSRRNGKRIAIAVVGGILVLAGVAMIALPGPGMLTIAAGLAVLATEYLWARRALGRVRDKIRGARGKLTDRVHKRLPAGK